MYHHIPVPERKRAAVIEVLQSDREVSLRCPDVRGGGSWRFDRYHHPFGNKVDDALRRTPGERVRGWFSNLHAFEATSMLLGVDGASPKNAMATR